MMSPFRTYDGNSRLTGESMAIDVPNEGTKIFSTSSGYDQANRRPACLPRWLTGHP